MCMKPAESKTDVRRDTEREPRRRPDPVHPGENTRPRANPDLDDHDMERGLERLTALVGR
jgi:hypothetical protein